MRPSGAAAEDGDSGMCDIVTGILISVGIFALVGSVFVYAYTAYEVIKSHDDMFKELTEDEEDEE